MICPYLILIFTVSSFLSQILEEQIAQAETFPFKDVIQILIPGPQDNVIEFVQFMLYWILAVITRLRLWKYLK